MKSLLYLAALLLSIGAMLWVDCRFRLFFWHDARRAFGVTAVGLVALTLADICGIALGIFERGEGEIASGLLIAPQLPIEEPVFLVLLILSTMVCFTGTTRLLAARTAGPAS